MAPRGSMNRQVKPRADIVEDDEEAYESEDSSPSVIETGDADGILSSSGEEEGDGSDGDGADAQHKLSSISFGTLAKAQDSLSRKRKRNSDTTPQQEDKLEALRARLRELKDAKGLKAGSKASAKDTSRAAGADQDGSADEEDSDASDKSEDEAPKSRSSKHAPMAQSSKKQVTRRRTVVDAPKRQVRDPRFGPMSGPVDETRLDNNYSFLDDYQSSEMLELKAAIKKSKDEDEKEMLKQSLMGMENRKRAKQAKERQQEVIREHRKKEKDAIKEGKQPFYLKRAEQKKLATVAKFNSMKGKDREKLIERRRKKASQKEKKSMPQARRIVG